MCISYDLSLHYTSYTKFISIQHSDGTPADDSPFREFFEDAVTERDTTVIEESTETETNDLTTSLLAEESTAHSP